MPEHSHSSEDEVDGGCVSVLGQVIMTTSGAALLHSGMCVQRGGLF